MLCPNSYFSYPFNILIALGGWVIKTDSSFVNIAYPAYKLFGTIVYCLGIYSLLLSLIEVFGDLNKMFWNVCATILVSSEIIKDVLMTIKSHILDALREKLYRDEMKANSKKLIEINMEYLKEFKRLGFTTLVFLVIVAPSLFGLKFFSYLWGPREWPLPLKSFVDIDPENKFHYNVFFGVQVVLGFLVFIYFLSLELCTYSILMQMCREFRKFQYEISLLNNLYEESETHSRYMEEINPAIRKVETKKMIRKLGRRQKELFRYIEDFEVVFNVPMLFQFTVGSILAISAGIQCLLTLGNQNLLSSNFTWLMVFGFIVIFDLFLLAIYATKIKSLCDRIGDEVYFTLWYKMDLDIQKDICLFIRRFQRVPKITAGKILELDLKTFMHAMRNIYSGLALFQQLLT